MTTGPRFLAFAEISASVLQYASRDGTPHERPRQGRDRPFGLPARLPLDLRARRRAAGRRQHRPRARRQGQQLHGRRHLRQGRALRRAHPSSRPADAPAAAQGPEGLRASSSASPGTTPSTSRPRPCWRPSARYGPEAVWPYYYAGTMGLVMRDGINRLRHAKRYSGMYATICTTLAWTGYIAGTGRLAGPDPREMAKSDLVVIWGTNPVNTQVNVMTHATRARKERGAKIVAVDIYQQRHHAAGRPGAVPAARHRRRARLRRHARAVPRRLRQLAVPGEIHRLPARAGSAPARRARRNGRAPSPA